MYPVHVVTDAADPTEDEFDELVERMSALSGVPSAPEGRIEVTISVEARDLGQAAEVAAVEAAFIVGHLPGRERVEVVAVEAITEAEQERRIGLPADAAA